MPTAAQHFERSASALSGGGGVLRIVPALAAQRSANGAMVLTRKFIDGVNAYDERWPGTVEVYLHQAAHGAGHLDEVEIDRARMRNRYQWRSEDDDTDARTIVEGADVLLVTLVDRNLQVIRSARAAGVPVVLITELSVRTRGQIIDAETVNPVVRWRRRWWSHRIEREYVRAVRGAAGVQCNGTPTYEAYRAINSNALLYFDTRVAQSMLATDEHVAARRDHLMSGAPLRLAFSGRLTAIKGADDLPRVSRRLRELKVPFKLDIIGGGEKEFESRLRRQIEEAELSDCVRMTGVMDFESELVPFMRRGADLFVCCHRQGDPSCTYIETLACGVPIAGYDNEAWKGMIQHGAPGWQSTMNDPEALAGTIAKLHLKRQALADAGEVAVRFASQHTFEAAMDHRVAHLLQSAGAAALERRG